MSKVVIAVKASWLLSTKLLTKKLTPICRFPSPFGHGCK